ncbi:MAG: hypothetical protein GX968_08680 [Tissierellia bacterium]|nr:hypothetical protein [Tissierellia bacterium]
MLKTFEEQYLVRYWELQRQQWCNYFEESRYDLSILDKEIYNLVCLYKDKIEIFDRKSQIANLLIKREFVDKNPHVSKLRNRIDNLENYNKDIPNEIREDNYKYKLKMSKRMKKDVLNLMDIRNSLAINNGYNSYIDLVLSTEEIDEEKLIELLNNYLDKNLHKAKEIIKKYNITFENWFEDLDRVYNINNSYNPNTLVDKLLKAFGFMEMKNRIKVYCDQNRLWGCAVEISPNDIRIAIEPIESLDSLRTLFHELGHAILYDLNKEEGLFRILPASLDESMAVVFEYMAPILLLDGDDKEKIYELMTLEYTRCAISALFEFELWQEPNKAEKLCEKHYGKLGLKIGDPNIWAYDSFRSIDPVYIHNYVIGASLAEKLIGHLSKLHLNDYIAWGEWLNHNIYFDGSKRKFRDKINAIVDFI